MIWRFLDLSRRFCRCDMIVVQSIATPSASFVIICGFSKFNFDSIGLQLFIASNVGDCEEPTSLRFDLAAVSTRVSNCPNIFARCCTVGLGRVAGSYTRMKFHDVAGKKRRQKGQQTKGLPVIVSSVSFSSRFSSSGELCSLDR